MFRIRNDLPADCRNILNLSTAYGAGLTLEQKIIRHIQEQPPAAGDNAHQHQDEPVDMLPGLHLLAAVLAILHLNHPLLVISWPGCLAVLPEPG